MSIQDMPGFWGFSSCASETSIGEFCLRTFAGGLISMAQPMAPLPSFISIFDAASPAFLSAISTSFAWLRFLCEIIRV